MAVGYRAILRLNHDAVEVAETHLRDWLREKSRGSRSTISSPDWEGPGVHRVGPRSDLVVVHDDHASGDRRRLYRLIETNAAGRWTVSLYVTSLSSSREHAQSIVVEVDRSGVDREVALATVDPPKIVRSILDSVASSDGAVFLTGEPIVVRSENVNEVIAAIEDERRTASVVVAGSLGPDLDDHWRQVVTSLTKQSVGVAATYVVFSDAMAELDAVLPPSHRVRPGHVRTYLPRVALDDPMDALRHKWLAPNTLTRSLNGRAVAIPLQRRHGEVARRRVVEVELPPDIRRAIDLLRRAETGVERAARVEERVAAQPRPTALIVVPESPPRVPIAASDEKNETPALPAPAASRLERLRVTFKRWLGIDDSKMEHFEDLDNFIEAKLAEVTVAEEQLSEAAQRQEDLQAERDQLQAELEDRDLDLAIAQEQQLKDQRELSVLRHRIAMGQHPEDAYVAADDSAWEAPSSVEELIGRLIDGAVEPHAISERVVFTGDLDPSLEVDRRDPTGRYVAAFWQQVRVLHDYAVARTNGFSGGVHVYLTDDRTDGIKCTPGQHASKESDTVINNPKWKKERVFSVPEDVDPSGFVFMEAHFKPTWRDTFAPRMYYLDDVARTGKIYVGYIGKHLSNTQS